MTARDRVDAVIDYGFTERQARFLVLVMRHAGLCVRRQYAAFAGIANGGEKCNAFFDKLVGRGFATRVECIHNRAQLFHVHHKPLYHAIGEADGRYRRAVSARSTAERLMRLDAALTAPDLDWLTTRSEKVAYVQASAARGASEHRADGAQRDGQDPANDFPGTFPIGIDPDGQVVVLYVATVPWTDDFRTFLLGHTALFSVTAAWTLRVLFPLPLRRAIISYQGVVHEELESPLQEQTINDLKQYFFHRRRGTDLNAIPAGLAALLRRRAEAFGGPRFNQAVVAQRRRSVQACSTRDSGGARVGSSTRRMRRLPSHVRASFPSGEPASRATEKPPHVGREGGNRVRTASTRLLTRFLNPVGHRRSFAAKTIRACSPRRKARWLQELARICCATDGAAFYAAPDSGSDQHGNGTQDVNDPASRLVTSPDGRSGVVHVLGSGDGFRRWARAPRNPLARADDRTATASTVLDLAGGG